MVSGEDDNALDYYNIVSYDIIINMMCIMCVLCILCVLVENRGCTLHHGKTAARRCPRDECGKW